MKLLPTKSIKNEASCLFTALYSLLSAMTVLLPILTVFVSTPVQAATKADYNSLPPFISSSVTPNVLFILDNSNSMDEDVDGAAVGSDAPNSRSEIARGAVKTIIDANKDTMRLGLMAYKQAAISHMEIHNSFYYSDYSSAHYDPLGVPTPKDPATNTKRYPNPTDPGTYIYYDTALPFYDSANQGTAFCYSFNGSPNNYRCYHKKTGDYATSTPLNLMNDAALSPYGYSVNFLNTGFVPTDDDIAAGFTAFGVEMSWVHVGKAWFANTSPGPGMLHQAIADSSVSEVSTATLPIAAALAGKYFLLSASATSNYYVWYKVSGIGPDPSVAGRTGIEVDVLSTDNAAAVATKTKTALNLVNTGLDFSAVSAAGTVTVTNKTTGNVADVTAGTAASSASVTTQGDDQILKLKKLLDTSQFVTATDIPLRNAGLTPLAGTVASANLYFQGNLLATEAAAGVNRTTPIQYPCQQNYVVLVTDGLPSTKANGATGTAAELIAELKDKITALRTTTVAGFTDPFDIQTFVIGFAIPPELGSQLDALAVAGGTDEGGHAILATDAADLAAKLKEVFQKIENRISSGTAASVISGSQSGTGAIYQSIFYPEFHDTSAARNKISWAGSVHASFVDASGRMREDTNIPGKRILDDDDLVLVFKKDAHNNVTVDKQDLLGNTVVSGASVEDINYLWNSNDYLNGISNTDIVTQRPYTSTTPGRYIFTFIDKDQTMIADPSEQVDFVVAPGHPTVSELDGNLHPDTLYPYIPVNSDSTALPSTASLTVSLVGGNLDEFLQHQTQRVINYIRGADQGTYTLTTGAGGTIPAFRSRGLDLDNNGTLETTWRLGDIVNSSPTVVGRPKEALHLLYNDASYATFVTQYEQRRNVVYTGANDGMLHAFNAGFYEDRFDVYSKTAGRYTAFTPAADKDGIKDIEYLLQPKDIHGITLTTDSLLRPIAAHPLGAELWAYIPYNLLPHLYWLTEPDYSSQKHVYYADLKPRIFDAKIFTPDADHPDGWGTVLVGGMRFGGGKITVDMNRTDGNVNHSDRPMTSAYYILDITNPEVPPTVLAEINFPNQGYTTCWPSVIAMGPNPSGGDPAQNDWYLVFGSGPADINGVPGTGAELTQAISKQSAKLYVVDLVKLARDKELVTLDTTGTRSSTAPYYYKSLDANSFISDPFTVDYQLDYKADAVYFGTVSGSAGSWGGKMRRIVIDNKVDPADWIGDSVLLDAGQPITVAPNASTDNSGGVGRNNRWVYFGTGRYFVSTSGFEDALNTDQQSFYGIKEPFTVDLITGDHIWSWNTVLNNTTTSLLDVSHARVFDDRSVTGVTGVTDWTSLAAGIAGLNGWKKNFGTIGERNLSQAGIFGGTLTYTTFVPSTDICSFGGNSFLSALYYTTGTAYFNSIIGHGILIGGKHENYSTISLGFGLASSGSIYSGSGREGTTVFVQNSTGDIIPIEVINAEPTKSGMRSWRLNEQ